MGDSFCSLIRSIFGDLSKISDLDETIVALIPKVEVVVNIK